MLRGVAGVLVLAVVLMMTSWSAQKGCRQATESLTHLEYYPIRDMRRTVAILPQKGWLAAPDTGSVPTVGREILWDREIQEQRFRLPGVADDSTIARGARKFMKTCVPCHGAKLDGQGPVAMQFMPPPDLLGEMSRSRSDGFIYSYIRSGGVVMPAYSAQVTAHEAWDLIHYIRHMQRTSPR